MNNVDKAYRALDKAAPRVFDDPNARDAFEFLKMAIADGQDEPSEAQVEAAWAVIGRGWFSRDIVRKALQAAAQVQND